MPGEGCSKSFPQRCYTQTWTSPGLSQSLLQRSSAREQRERQSLQSLDRLKKRFYVKDVPDGAAASPPAKTATQQAGQLTALHFTAQVFTGLLMAQCLWATTHNNNSNNGGKKPIMLSDVACAAADARISPWRVPMRAAAAEIWRQRWCVRGGSPGFLGKRKKNFSWK